MRESVIVTSLMSMHLKVIFVKLTALHIVHFLQLLANIFTGFSCSLLTCSLFRLGLFCGLPFNFTF